MFLVFVGFRRAECSNSADMTWENHKKKEKDILVRSTLQWAFCSLFRFGVGLVYVKCVSFFWGLCLLQGVRFDLYCYESTTSYRYWSLLAYVWGSWLYLFRCLYTYRWQWHWQWDLTMTMAMADNWLPWWKAVNYLYVWLPFGSVQFHMWSCRQILTVLSNTLSGLICRFLRVSRQSTIILEKTSLINIWSQIINAGADKIKVNHC